MATDPLIAALFDKVPAPGSPFPSEARAAWLKMAAMAFDVAYGPAEDIPAFLPTGGAGAPTRKLALVTSEEPPRFYIAADGRALRDPGRVPIGVNDVPHGETLWDERPAGARELDTIVWKDGEWPADALPPLNIANAGGSGGGGAAVSGA